MDIYGRAGKLVGFRVLLTLAEGTAVRGRLNAVTSSVVELARDDGGAVASFDLGEVVGIAEAAPAEDAAPALGLAPLDLP